MANHKLALKRIRRNEAAHLRNRCQHRTTRSAVRKLRTLENQEEAKVLFPKTVSVTDKLTKRSIIHADKAANLKNSSARHLSELAK